MLSEKDELVVNKITTNTVLTLDKLPALPDDCTPKEEWIMTQIHYSVENTPLSKLRVYCYIIDGWKTVAEIIGSQDVPKNATHFTVLMPTKFLFGQYKESVFPLTATEVKDQSFYFSRKLEDNKHVELLGDKIKRKDA